MSVRVNIAGLSAGTFNGAITISASGATNTPQTTTVTLTVDPPPRISRGPSSKNFTATEGGPNPSNQTLRISNSGGGTLNWSVSDNQSWLSLSPTSGSSTGETDTVSVRVNIAGLSDGTYNATITISASGATNTPRTTSVTLIVDPASSIPILSNIRYVLVSLNDSTACAFQNPRPGSFFHVRVDYSDPDGDVTSSGTVVNTAWQFNPGIGGSFQGSAAFSGTPFSGTIRIGNCYRFVNAGSVDVTVTITDAGGNTSNSLTINIPKPSGSNAPNRGTSDGGSAMTNSVGRR
ncbi:MAG: hypothetical protein ACE1ZS_08320 [Candidatus Poribacteria bacterium]